MGATTVKEFTNGEYKELKFTLAPAIQGLYIPTIVKMLAKCEPEETSSSGIDLNHEFFTIKTDQLVRAFQKRQGFKVDGIITDDMLNAIISVASNISDIIYSEGTEAGSNAEAELTSNPKYDSFFSSENEKLTRKNKQDIVIELGNATIKKTIHNVFIRSVSTEFDTSGNPISEVYEFIAQDLTESDEAKDNNKY